MNRDWGVLVGWLIGGVAGGGFCALVVFLVHVTEAR